MKRYPAYKPESRLPGVTEVPEHWKVLRNSVIFREVSETGYGDLELLSILSDRGVIKQSETGRKERAPEDRSQYKRILKGDIGYNLMNAFIGAIGVSNYDGIISPAYAVCRPKIEIDATYFHYLFRTDLYLTEFDRNAYGIMDERNRLYFDNFKKIYVPFPPINEQRRIVTYINHKLAQIDQFICYKRRLIELLNEQKTALINRAVTKGLDPDVPMKPSGSLFYPSIPAHWEMVKLGYLCNKIADGPHFSPKYVDRGIMFLSARNIKVNFWHLEDAKYISEDDYREFGKRIIPEKGDILYTKGGTTGVARVVDLEQPFQVWVHVAVLKLRKDKINSYLLASILNSSSCYEQSQLHTHGATNNDLGLTRMRNIELAIPPSAKEQNKILDYINSESSKIDDAIAQAEKEIELIQEYRTTLISDAVTGKIDVRDTLERGAALVTGGV